MFEKGIYGRKEITRYKHTQIGFRPAKSPDLGRRLPYFFIALPALRLSRENLRQNYKISSICFRTTF